MLGGPNIILWYLPNMAAKPVQISLDAELLRRIDSDPEARQKGRSAFVRSAVLLYLEAKRKQQVDASIRRAFAARDPELQAVVDELMTVQQWPTT
jgi:metal-responsive CopG/Arc/MetJ family transcriptional regulator